MSWKRGKYIGNPPPSRFGHTSTAIGPHLLIFGGWEYTKAQNEIIVLREFTNKLGENATGPLGHKILVVTIMATRKTRKRISDDLAYSLYYCS
jgi:hypothetical protein